MAGATQPCPGCSARLPENPRYPANFCSACCAGACDEDGRAVAFTNISPSEALPGLTVGARYRDSGEVYPSEDCVVAGIASRAREARFGGIVIQPAVVWERTGQA
jgi:hypothetical protein